MSLAVLLFGTMLMISGVVAVVSLPFSMLYGSLYIVDASASHPPRVRTRSAPVSKSGDFYLF